MNGCLGEQFSIVLAPGIGFVEDNFSVDRGEEGGFQMTQAPCTSCVLYFSQQHITSAPPQIIWRWILDVGDPSSRVKEFGEIGSDG